MAVSLLDFILKAVRISIITGGYVVESNL